MSREVYVEYPLVAKWAVGFPRIHLNGHQWFTVHNPNGEVKFFPYQDYLVEQALAGEIAWDIGIPANPFNEETAHRMVANEALIEFFKTKEPKNVINLMVESDEGIRGRVYETVIEIDDNGEPTGSIKIEEWGRD